MSELDADLYGDLYGTEDLAPGPTIENAHTEPQENSTPAEHHSPTPVAEPVMKNVATPPKSSATMSPMPIASWSEPSSSVVERPAPLPVTNIPQQIPTYQDTNNDDRGASRSTYHGVAVEERSVRPSEMKDEG